MMDVLQRQAKSGVKETQWSQVAQLLTDRDKNYLTKNGIPDSFAAYVGLCEKNRLIVVHRNDGKGRDTISLMQNKKR